MVGHDVSGDLEFAPHVNLLPGAHNKRINTSVHAANRRTDAHPVVIAERWVHAQGISRVSIGDDHEQGVR